jgi:hypothetical protein
MRNDGPMARFERAVAPERQVRGFVLPFRLRGFEGGGLGTFIQSQAVGLGRAS